MARNRYTVEQIIARLRGAETELASGLTTPEVYRKLRIGENTLNQLAGVSPWRSR